jgi:hypothetical protein
MFVFDVVCARVVASLCTEKVPFRGAALPSPISRPPRPACIWPVQRGATPPLSLCELCPLRKSPRSQTNPRSSQQALPAWVPPWCSAVHSDRRGWRLLHAYCWSWSWRSWGKLQVLVGIVSKRGVGKLITAFPDMCVECLVLSMSCSPGPQLVHAPPFASKQTIPLR